MFSFKWLNWVELRSRKVSFPLNFFLQALSVSRWEFAFIKRKLVSHSNLDTPVHRNTQMPSSHAFGCIPHIWMIKKPHSEGEGRGGGVNTGSSLVLLVTWTNTNDRSGLVFIPLPSFIPQLGEFNPKFHFHNGSAFQYGSGLLASQNQRKLNSGYLNHPALESAGREASKTSAQGRVWTLGSEPFCS